MERVIQRYEVNGYMCGDWSRIKGQKFERLPIEESWSTVKYKQMETEAVWRSTNKLEVKQVTWRSSP